MKVFFDTFGIPLGDFSVAVHENGAVAATAFGGAAALQRRLPGGELARERRAVADARDQLLAYFAGESRAFELPLDPRGTPFQRRVWAALLRIPFAVTRSYGELARDLGVPGAARAVGRANARNPLCVILPCHRVVGSDGSLTGFAFGQPVKRWLLDHERARAAGGNQPAGPSHRETPRQQPVRLPRNALPEGRCVSLYNERPKSLTSGSRRTRPVYSFVSTNNIQVK
jgi:methylated-DNA-[protein]-cysteine S-methyltransferase